MKSFFLGLTLGLGAALLMAPAKGYDTRQRIAEKAGKLKTLRRRKPEKKLRYGRQQPGEIRRKAADEAFNEAVRRVAGET